MRILLRLLGPRMAVRLVNILNKFKIVGVIVLILVLSDNQKVVQPKVTNMPTMIFMACNGNPLNPLFLASDPWITTLLKAVGFPLYLTYRAGALALYWMAENGVLNTPGQHVAIDSIFGMAMCWWLLFTLPFVIFLYGRFLAWCINASPDDICHPGVTPRTAEEMHMAEKIRTRPLTDDEERERREQAAIQEQRDKDMREALKMPFW